jgi:hypothetical protein
MILGYYGDDPLNDLAKWELFNDCIWENWGKSLTNLEMIKFDWYIKQYTLCHGGIDKKNNNCQINKINKFRKVINNTVS